MQLIRRLEDYTPDVPLALAIGNFDGLHKGHEAVLTRTRAIAKEARLAPAVLTFEPHPRQFFAPTTPAFRLQTFRDKIEGLRDAGVERIFTLKFDAAMAGLSAEDFLEKVLRQKMNTRAVITGENFSYGRGRGGDIAMLRAWGIKQNIRTEQLKPVITEGDVVSSTAVRAALEVGDMHHAEALLGRPYSVSGRVRRGERKGRELGYPTLNIAPPAMLKLPRTGIYVARATWEGECKNGVASFGLRPSLNPLTTPLLEVHLFDHTADLYGQRVKVELMHYLREEKHFDSVDALAHQIGNDARDAQQYFKEHCHG